MDRGKKAIVLLGCRWERIVVGSRPGVWGLVDLAALSCAWEVTAVRPA